MSLASNVFKLYDILKFKRLTIQEIMDRYSVSKRTAYRYLSFLESHDVVLEQDFDDRYYIITK